MFIASERRAQFYVERGLVTSDPENPKHLTLKKSPPGYGFYNTALHEYHLRPKVNQCVVCASQEELTKHHVLPIIFQRYYPNERGDAGVRSHDLLLLCLECHERYEQDFANPTREEMAKQYGANRHHRLETNIALARVIKNAKTLVRTENIPVGIRDNLLSRIKSYIGNEPTDEDVAQLARLTWKNTKRLAKQADLGKKVTDAWDLGKLRKFWRRHFVESMNPQCLPKGWSVDAPVERQFITEA